MCGSRAVRTSRAGSASRITGSLAGRQAMENSGAVDGGTTMSWTHVGHVMSLLAPSLLAAIFCPQHGQRNLITVCLLGCEPLVVECHEIKVSQTYSVQTNLPVTRWLP